MTFPCSLILRETKIKYKLAQKHINFETKDLKIRHLFSDSVLFSWGIGICNSIH